MTKTSTRARAGARRRPSCSSSAVKTAGPSGDPAAGRGLLATFRPSMENVSSRFKRALKSCSIDNTAGEEVFERRDQARQVGASQMLRHDAADGADPRGASQTPVVIDARLLHRPPAREERLTIELGRLERRTEAPVAPDVHEFIALHVARLEMRAQRETLAQHALNHEEHLPGAGALGALALMTKRSDSAHDGVPAIRNPGSSQASRIKSRSVISATNRSGAPATRATRSPGFGLTETTSNAGSAPRSCVPAISRTPSSAHMSVAKQTLRMTVLRFSHYLSPPRSGR